jgi:hypothetical protein
VYDAATMSRQSSTKLNGRPAAASFDRQTGAVYVATTSAPPPDCAPTPCGSGVAGCLDICSSSSSQVMSLDANTGRITGDQGVIGIPTAMAYTPGALSVFMVDPCDRDIDPCVGPDALGEVLATGNNLAVVLQRTLDAAVRSVAVAPSGDLVVSEADYTDCAALGATRTSELQVLSSSSLTPIRIAPVQGIVEGLTVDYANNIVHGFNNAAHALQSYHTQTLSTLGVTPITATALEVQVGPPGQQQFAYVAGFRAKQAA